MSGHRVQFLCVICGATFTHGPGLYEGHLLGGYGGEMCCETCWKANHDGWAPHAELVLREILQRKGLPEPARNAKGLWPRG